MLGLGSPVGWWAVVEGRSYIFHLTFLRIVHIPSGFKNCKKKEKVRKTQSARARSQYHVRIEYVCEISDVRNLALSEAGSMSRAVEMNCKLPHESQ